MCGRITFIESACDDVKYMALSHIVNICYKTDPFLLL